MGLTPSEDQGVSHPNRLEWSAAAEASLPSSRYKLPEQLYGTGRIGIQFNSATHLCDDWHQELGRIASRLGELSNNPAFEQDPGLRTKWIERLIGNTTGCQTYTEAVHYRIHPYILKHAPPPHPSIEDVVAANRSSCDALDELATRIKGWGQDLRAGKPVQVRSLLLLMEIGYEILEWERPEIFNSILEAPLQKMIDEYQSQITRRP